MDYAFDNRLDFTLFDKQTGLRGASPHFHPYSQIVIPRGEGVTIKIGSSEAFELPADGVLFLSPFVRHDIQSSKEGVCLDSLSVNLSRLGAEFSNSPYLTPIHALVKEGYGGILFSGGTAMHARREFFMIRNDFRMEYMLATFQILHHLANAKDYRILASEQHHPVEEREIQLCMIITNFIRENLNQPIDIRRVANHVHMSDSSFNRFFKRFFGCPFHAYLLDKKIEAACYLLYTTNKPIQEIADELYFNSASHFAMTFKRHQGITPGEYRRRQTLA